MDSTILADNAAQTRRLERLVADSDIFGHDLGGGWTVAIALAHLAFWDRRAVLLLKRWEDQGTPPDDPDDDVLNSALLEEWRALPPQLAAGLAVESAHSIDATVEGLNQATVTEVQARGDQWLLHRGKHRREHIDQIEKALRRGR